MSGGRRNGGLVSRGGFGGSFHPRCRCRYLVGVGKGMYHVGKRVQRLSRGRRGGRGDNAILVGRLRIRARLLRERCRGILEKTRRSCGEVGGEDRDRKDGEIVSVVITSTICSFSTHGW